MDVLQLFAQRLYADWLPAYCRDPRRNYDPSGFIAASIKVCEADARDCMAAIDLQVVVDTGGGRFRARRSLTHEVLFWEGFKAIAPRPISLWLEPVITLAALARLHLRYSWPKESLGAQSKDWAFDLAAYGPRDGPPAILGEVKKSSRELQQLKEDLLRLSDGGAPESVRTNSAKKWQAVVASRPGLVWLVGPNEEAYVYQHEVTDRGCRLIEVEPVALACRG
jgi:hypothetical protein